MPKLDTVYTDLNILKQQKSGAYISIYSSIEKKWYQGTLLAVSISQGEERFVIGYDDGDLGKHLSHEIEQFKFISRPQSTTNSILEYISPSNGNHHKNKYVVDQNTGEVTLFMDNNRAYHAGRYAVPPANVKHVPSAVKAELNVKTTVKHVPKRTAVSTNPAPKRGRTTINSSAAASAAVVAATKPVPVTVAPKPITPKPTPPELMTTEQQIAATLAKLEALKKQKEQEDLAARVNERVQALMANRQQQLELTQKLRAETKSMLTQLSNFNNLVSEAEELVRPDSLTNFAAQHPSVPPLSFIFQTMTEVELANSLFTDVIKPFVDGDVAAKPKIKRARML